MSPLVRGAPVLTRKLRFSLNKSVSKWFMLLASTTPQKHWSYFTTEQTAMSYRRQTPVVSGTVLQLWKHMIWHQRRTMSRHVSHEALSNMQLLDITCDLFTHWACSATVRSTTSTTDLHSNVPIKEDMCCSVEVLLSTNTGEKKQEWAAPSPFVFPAADSRAHWVRILSP